MELPCLILLNADQTGTLTQLLRSGSEATFRISGPGPSSSLRTVFSDGHICVLLFFPAFAIGFSLVAENHFVKRGWEELRKFYNYLAMRLKIAKPGASWLAERFCNLQT